MDKDRYHHGDLANALIAAALAAVERDGVADLSLRSLAERLGVSRAAPYRHFPDRDALLAAVAARGFEALCEGYETALATPGNGVQALRAATRFYMDFASGRPGLHGLMFHTDFLTRTPPPAVLIPPANRAYDLLMRLVSATIPDADDRARKARTITVWSTTFGFVALRAAGRFKPFMRDPLEDAEIEAAILEAVAPLGAASAASPVLEGVARGLGFLKAEALETGLQFRTDRRFNIDGAA